MKRKILMASFLAPAVYCSHSGQIWPEPTFYLYHEGAIIRGDSAIRNLALVFTGDEFADGGMHILSELAKQEVTGSFFLPPYEWYKDTIAAWTGFMDLKLINYTPGTLSHTDYTLPGTQEYKSSLDIYRSIKTKGLYLCKD